MMMSPMPESQTRGGSVVVWLEDKREPFVQSSPPRRDSYARYACAHVSVLATSPPVRTSTPVLCLSQPLLILVSLCQDWLDKHQDNPYPTVLQKEELCKKTQWTRVSP
jgi:hypothetical protein